MNGGYGLVMKELPCQSRNNAVSASSVAAGNL